MLTMQPASITKMGKPPPPVPPRPSKILVAEALAKTGKSGPVRSAPPPPVENGHFISRSQSSASVKKPVPLRRNISEEVKSSNRTVVFQSSNIKRKEVVRNESFGTKVNVNKSESFKSDGNTKSDNVKSFLNFTPKNQIKRNESFSISSEKTKVFVSGVESTNKTQEYNSVTAVTANNITVNKPQPCSEKVVIENTIHKTTIANEKVSNCEIVITNGAKLINNDNSSLNEPEENDKQIGSKNDKQLGSKNDSFCESDSKSDHNCDYSQENWDEMLKDRNHVNTLIDEMFASVLEVSGSEEHENMKNNQMSIENNAKTVISTNDQTVIDANSETKSTTVLIIENEQSNEHVSEMSLSKTNCSTTEHTEENKSNSSTFERKKVKFDDKMNHELLISELQSMKKEQERILKRQRKPSQSIYEDETNEGDKNCNIQRSDWVEVDNGEEVRLSSCQINIAGLDNGDKAVTLDYERINNMSSLHGLPPLPKSLSGFSLLDNQNKAPATPVRTSSMRATQPPPPPAPSSGHLVYPPHPKLMNGVSSASDIVSTPPQSRKTTSLDTQLAILRREMYSLRQLDLSLLSQLWSLNESIQDFRQILQDQEDRVLSPPSPSPTPSSGDEAEGDDLYISRNPFRPIPPPARRPSNSSNISTGG